MKRLGFFFSSNQPLVDYHARFSCPEKRFDVSYIDFSECLQSLDRHIHHILLSCMTILPNLQSQSFISETYIWSVTRLLMAFHMTEFYFLSLIYTMVSLRSFKTVDPLQSCEVNKNSSKIYVCFW